MDKTKKIALVELAMHNEVLSNYAHLLLAGGFELTIFTNGFNFSQILPMQEELKWVLQQSDETNPQFAERIKPQLAAYSLVIFTTIENHISFFKSFSITPPKALVVHKLNMFINPRKSFLFNEDRVQWFKDLVKIVRYQVFNEKKLFLDFIKSFDHLIFPSEHVQQFLVEQEWDKGLPSHSVINFAIHEQLAIPPSTSGVVNITIPGIISSKSRDYKVVLDAFRKITLSRPVKLRLLGRPKGRYGQRIVRGFRALKQANLEVVFYDQFVEQAEFDEVLKQSDFLILPISRYMKVSIFKELNGFTCVSGNINDMMRFGIPSIIAGFYPLPKGLQALTSPFNNALELRTLVESWVEQKLYLEKRTNAEDALFPYQLQELAKRVKQQFIFSKYLSH